MHPLFLAAQCADDETMRRYAQAGSIQVFETRTGWHPNHPHEGANVGFVQISHVNSSGRK
jgi:hypothetical protein